jgi:hypothetical protein
VHAGIGLVCRAPAPPQQRQAAHRQQESRRRFGHRRQQHWCTKADVVAGVGDDLAGVVDADRVHQHLGAEACRNEVQIDEVGARIHERVRKAVVGEARIADHDAGRIDGMRLAVVAAERTEVVHDAAAVQERMPDGLGTDEAVANHLARVVHGLGRAEAAAKGAEIVHDPAHVQEGVGAVVRKAHPRLRSADDHACVVDAPRLRIGPAQRPEVRQCTVAVQERAAVAGCVGGSADDLATGIDAIGDAVAAVQRADGLHGAIAPHKAARDAAGLRGADDHAVAGGGRVRDGRARRGQERRRAVAPDEGASLESGVETGADDAAVVADAEGLEIFRQEGGGVQRPRPRGRTREQRQQQGQQQRQQQTAYRHGRLPMIRRANDKTGDAARD